MKNYSVSSSCSAQNNTTHIKSYPFLKYHLLSMHFSCKYTFTFCVCCMHFKWNANECENAPSEGGKGTKIAISEATQTKPQSGRVQRTTLDPPRPRWMDWWLMGEFSVKVHLFKIVLLFFWRHMQIDIKCKWIVKQKKNRTISLHPGDNFKKLFV